MFWRDLETWSSFRDVKKLYLAASEKLEIGEKVDIYELDKRLFQKNESNPETGNGNNSTGDNDGSETKEKQEGDEKKKKRKNRWGVAPSATEAVEFTPINPVNEFQPPETINPSPSDVDQNGEDNKKPRRSRWSTAPAITAGPANSDPSPTPSAVAPSIPASPFTLTPEIMQQTLVLQMQLKQLNDKLLTVVQDAAIEELNPNRPPSPPPKYDSNGKRLNTREVRMREALTAQRTAVIEQMMKINPLFQVHPFSSFLSLSFYTSPLQILFDKNLSVAILFPIANIQTTISSDLSLVHEETHKSEWRERLGVKLVFVGEEV